MHKIFLLIVCCSLSIGQAHAQKTILPGAYQTSAYFHLLQNKKVGLFVNQTSRIGTTHLIDTLLKSGIQVQKIFTPEHGLRGNADAGEKVNDGFDEKTGIPIVSLYGKKNAPSNKDLQNVDILVFDIQDVGTRFYTYINSLQYFMEAALANNKPLIILDRPNPNSHFIDGPILEAAFKSGVGKQPIPIVYGMTMGEYALMLRGEKWMKLDSTMAQQNSSWSLRVIRNKNYTHNSKYILPVAPSPNLPDMHSIVWYPTTCLIEGTVLSEGRGTAHAFAYIGHPSLKNKKFSFTPTARTGAMTSKCYGQTCYGWDLTKVTPPINKIDIGLLIEIYQSFPQKDSFFLASNSKESNDYFFNKLAGNADLMQQLKKGASENEIRKSWTPGLVAFKKIRKKYLLYKE
ncbi:MAG: hypothetical protein RLZ56_740 [Bacteroidota bacterium]|jgi:uncharacterized protein YbbC (DUF1343 family)